MTSEARKSCPCESGGLREGQRCMTCGRRWGDALPPEPPRATASPKGTPREEDLTRERLLLRLFRDAVRFIRCQEEREVLTLETEKLLGLAKDAPPFVWPVRETGEPPWESLRAFLASDAAKQGDPDA